jgi:hypothetical protein
MTLAISEEKMSALLDALLAGRKIEAIKLYRESTGVWPFGTFNIKRQTGNTNPSKAAASFPIDNWDRQL